MDLYFFTEESYRLKKLSKLENKEILLATFDKTKFFINFFKPVTFLLPKLLQKIKTDFFKTKEDLDDKMRLTKIYKNGHNYWQRD